MRAIGGKRHLPVVRIHDDTGNGPGPRDLLILDRSTSWNHHSNPAPAPADIGNVLKLSMIIRGSAIGDGADQSFRFLACLRAKSILLQCREGRAASKAPVDAVGADQHFLGSERVQLIGYG